MMQEKDKQEKEAAKQKQKRKEERERKKIEREQEKERKAQERQRKKQEREEKKQEKERQQAEKKWKRAGKVQQAPKPKSRCRGREVQDQISESDDSTSSLELLLPGPTRSSRKTRLPSRFRDSSDSGSDSDGRVVCGLCQARELAGSTRGPIFWIDCDSCGEWVHTFCAFGKKTMPLVSTCVRTVFNSS